MSPRKPAKSSAPFVDRHGLWSADQARLAREVERAIKVNKLELVRFSFA